MQSFTLSILTLTTLKHAFLRSQIPLWYAALRIERLLYHVQYEERFQCANLPSLIRRPLQSNLIIALIKILRRNNGRETIDFFFRPP